MLTPDIARLYDAQPWRVEDRGRFNHNLDHAAISNGWPPLRISETGADFWLPQMGGGFIRLHFGFNQCRPILRRLDSITEEEAREIHEMMHGFGYSGIIPAKEWVLLKFPGESNTIQDAIGTPLIWLRLIEMGIDLFGLIDAGDAEELAP